MDTVLALSYEVWFLAVWSDGKKAVGEAWAIMGLVAKLAQSVSTFSQSSTPVLTSTRLACVSRRQKPVILTRC